MSKIEELKHISNNALIVSDNLITIMQAAYIDYRKNGASDGMTWIENHLKAAGEIPNTNLSAEEWYREHNKEVSFFDKNKDIAG